MTTLKHKRMWLQEEISLTEQAKERFRIFLVFYK